MGALAREQIANATRDGFSLKQGTKAKMYAKLKQVLGFNVTHMAQYFKIKSVQGQESKRGKVVVGVTRMGRSGSDLSRHPRVELGARAGLESETIDSFTIK